MKRVLKGVGLGLGLGLVAMVVSLGGLGPSYNRLWVPTIRHSVTYYVHNWVYVHPWETLLFAVGIAFFLAYCLPFRRLWPYLVVFGLGVIVGHVVYTWDGV